MTEEYESPDHRCGFELKPNDMNGDLKTDLDEWYKKQEAVCCWRETWRDGNLCVWHSETECKPVEELNAARVDGSERLDGAYLAGIEVSVDNDISFKGCVLKSATFSDGEFFFTQPPNIDSSTPQFHDTDLQCARFDDTLLAGIEFFNADLRDAQFHDAILFQTKFHDAFVVNTSFLDAEFNHVEFHESSLADTQFHDAYIYKGQFHDAYLRGTEFNNACLRGTEFRDADLPSAQFHDASLPEVQFNSTSLSGSGFYESANFHDADLTDTGFTESDARDTDFTHATLHDTLFTRTDCRGATFTNALLYETVFSDTRINSQTTFYDPEATFYDSITARPAVVYEENPLTVDNLPEDTHPLEAAEWVYRRLEKLHDENALSEQAREYHISKEEAQRKYQYESEEYARYAVSTLQWYVTGHGESIPRIFRSAAVLILVCGGLYPFVGGFESSSAGAAYRLHLFSVDPSRAAIGDTIATVLQSIYFSVITFTTIGYGDLYPTGAGSKILVGFESLSGAILIALFVFVLGRRVAR